MSSSPEFWTVTDTVKRVASGEISAVRAVNTLISRITNLDRELGAYLSTDETGALRDAAEVDRRRKENIPLGPLAGVPIALKDNLVTRGIPTTAGSKILQGWVPPFDATVVEKLRAAGAVILGKANLDEFGMGSSTERSAYKKTRNPWDTSRVPGGSSGGSAAAVAAGLAAASLGTDTGGSIRQPAAFCGVVGLKPTYGRVSRWGVIAFASSLDQVGPLTRTVKDAALVLQVIAGHDLRDSTSLDAPVPAFADAATGDVKGMKIGLPKEYFEGAIDADIRAALDRTIAALKDKGALFDDVSLPHTKLALPAYYLVAPAEASSNLARYDGIRYGKRAEGTDLLDVYRKSRGAGFGPEVKRRIMLGTYALRSGYYEAYYKKAQQIRALIKRDFDEVFAKVDVVLTPTTPTVAFRFNAKATPLDMYLGDIFTLACNLAGLPGMSVPCGISSDGLPIGAQLLGKPLDEVTVIRAGSAIEAAVGLGERRPAGIGGI
ncbi:MAG: Asp-tRNA(Asn)/Glu-tRNA(Gln) amidotransferase subunit GatA [Deltaproteobacteria bacterium]|nr:Asp-tRNA(Asn)/Glu-tRNA(Gln) amidotransferase subunit GatA [Deltaproteobacteria bacterium]